MNVFQNIFQALLSIPATIKNASTALVNSWYYIYYMTHVSYAPIKVRSVRSK